jgi:hypothetical protein
MACSNLLLEGDNRMKQSNFLIFVAVIVLIYAVAALLVPEMLLSQYGFTVNPVSIFLMRLAGVQFVLEGLLAWFARNVRDSHALRAINLAYFIAFALGGLNVLFGIISGVLSAFGWTAVGLDVVLALGFGYFLFVKSSGV